jgi:hypothetical protein
MEPVLNRGEAVGAVFVLHDILEEVRNIRELLEDDGTEEEEEIPEE